MAHVTQLFTSCSYILCESEHKFGCVVGCSGTVGGKLLMSLQNVQADALPPAHGHADYTKMHVFPSTIQAFLFSQNAKYAGDHAWKYGMCKH